MLSRVIYAATAALLLTGAGDAPATPSLTLNLVLTGLRSNNGEVRLCIWRHAERFPNCKRGEDVRLMSAPAAAEVRVAVTDLLPGSYAVSVIHDENGNRKLDKNFMGIPTEGVGFSRNAAMTFGPPSFAKASFDASAEPVQTIRMKYFL